MPVVRPEQETSSTVLPAGGMSKRYLPLRCALYKNTNANVISSFPEKISLYGYIPYIDPIAFPFLNLMQASDSSFLADNKLQWKMHSPSKNSFLIWHSYLKKM
ncbi:hypothetical protein FRACYDRAFT_243922 [Fragilariopsis cylindrus CCMP1102]|uniref:Uncharacterized protein n=1 Tax=Fragilariopsis cylindrus CCMP1102 TaxID=635003 RepID=A0A1E7F3T4_9STRA|nr:hypothetical protein FRACYDRAFT_243922 [Fragilariopsis cylindrus CCMP1102]|eukprot:OEU12665.1 hypothetical protein FRACYDRAFT_243922 [Fragilariopsis cylindrus CCMP1102]